MSPSAIQIRFSLLHEATGTWSSAFDVAIAADLLKAALALAVLKLLRRD